MKIRRYFFPNVKYLTFGGVWTFIRGMRILREQVPLIKVLAEHRLFMTLTLGSLLCLVVDQDLFQTYQVFGLSFNSWSSEIFLFLTLLFALCTWDRYRLVLEIVKTLMPLERQYALSNGIAVDDPVVAT